MDKTLEDLSKQELFLTIKVPVDSIKNQEAVAIAQVLINDTGAVIITARNHMRTQTRHIVTTIGSQVRAIIKVDSVIKRGLMNGQKAKHIAINTGPKKGNLIKVRINIPASKDLGSKECHQGSLTIQLDLHQ